VSELIYTFASLAARTAQGKTCLDGMRVLADIMHPRGVPVTWLVSPESAAIAKDTLTDWHHNFGDEAAVELPPLEGTFEEKKKYLEDRRDRSLRLCPGRA